jgi:enoyl-CoA hydratase
MAFTSDVLTIERDGHVATLWLDNPERRNAFGPAIWDDLPRAMQELNDDAQVRAVVIAAKGTAFTVGLDLKAMGFGQMGGPADEGSDAGRRLRTYRELKRLQASITAVADCPKPVVAAVHGWCLGAGVDLITACDVRLAAADATFSVRETRVAIVADVGTLQRLPKVIAPGHAAELVYTGKDIDAARAREIGLVNDVHADHDAVVQAARQMAADIAANSPMAVQGSKAVMRAGDEMTVAQGLDFVALWNASFAQSNDLVEAMTAFMQKRPPTFTGE